MLDVQTVFLDADVEEEVFVKMVPGYETYDKGDVHFVMKLKKSLYGLRQSPTNWFGTRNSPPAQVVSVRMNLREHDNVLTAVRILGICSLCSLVTLAHCKCNG